MKSLYTNVRGSYIILLKEAFISKTDKNNKCKHVMHKPQRPKSAKGRTRPSRYQRLLTSPAGTERNKGNTKLLKAKLLMHSYIRKDNITCLD